MNEFTCYMTNSLFRGEQFANMLNAMGIKACAMTEKVIFDRTAFNAVKAWEMPHWLYMNRKFMTSPFHTRPATAEEIAKIS